MTKSKISEAVKFITNKNNRLFAIILIIGIVFMTVLPGHTKIKQSSIIPDAGTEEKRLEQILSEISGAGKVDVMITFDGSSEKNIAYETKTSSADTERNTSGSEDKKAVISGGEPVVVQEKYPKVKGVIVVAQGGGSIEVKRALTEAVVSVMSVAACNVRVYEGK